MTFDAVAGWICSAARWFGSDAAGNLGGLVGGAAAVYAVFWGRSEVRRWLRQKEKEKRRDAAGQCLVALNRATRALGRWTGNIASAEAVISAEVSLWVAARTSFDEGSAWAKNPMAELRAIHPLALAYLSREERSPIEQALGLCEVIEDEFYELISKPGERSPGDFKKGLLSFDRLTRSAIDIAAEGDAILGPLARYER